MRNESLNLKLRFQLILFFTVFSVVLIVFFASLNLTRIYNDDIQGAENKIANLTRLMAENVSLSLSNINMLLTILSQENSLDIINTNFLPYLQGIIIVDSNGIVIESIKLTNDDPSTLPQPGNEFMISGNLTRHRAIANADILITQGEQNTNNTPILLSKRITTHDGSFNGAVIAMLTSNYMEHLLTSLDDNKKSGFALLLDNTRFLTSKLANMPSLALLKLALQESSFLKNRIEDVRITHKKIRDEHTLFAFRRLSNLPITIAVVMYEEDIFSRYRNYLYRFIALFALLGFFTIFMFLVIYRLNTRIKNLKTSEETAIIANRAKTEFFAKMSHELRTPLSAVIGLSEILLQGKFGSVNEKQKRKLGDINLCGHHLLELINEILDYTKGESGKLKLNVTDVNINDLIDTSFKFVGPRAEMANIELIKNIPANLPNIQADYRKLKQIMLNLLDNAIKFSPKGGHVTVNVYLSKGDMIIEVADNGIGIKEEDIPIALSLFEQVKNGQKDYEGSGLGLPLCKMFTELHNGTFTLRSKKGHGTTAIVTLPKFRVNNSSFV